MIDSGFKETQIRPAAQSELPEPAPADTPLILPKLVSVDGQAPAANSSAPELSDYERGKQDGEAAARQRYDETVRVMEAALDTLKTEYQKLGEQIEASHLSAVRQYIDPLIPMLIRDVLSLQVEELVQLACSQAVHGPVEFIVSQNQAPHLQTWLAPHADKISLKIDETLKGTQMQLRWPHGGARFDAEAIKENWQALIGSLLGGDKPSSIKGGSHE